MAPSDGTVLDADALTFNWEPLKEAEGYNVQVATPNFENGAQLIKYVGSFFGRNGKAKNNL
ncbi:hypothetical protein [Allomuricauda sp. F6463D]|uniref:hypothetical protein n=1 Tax=Allomuricauda sp. F6463D TaxID=2926409 RepID=UPI001FF265EB|nr:hypothetical protein [Muricauda sp. F6463D]MCK0159124.1 hypothetical protein [Muricauda sp. F6463D]